MRAQLRAPGSMQPRPRPLAPRRAHGTRSRRRRGAGWQQRLGLHRWSTRPFVLALACLALVGCAAVLYLSAVSGVETANAQLQAARNAQTRLTRQDADLHRQLGTAESPATIDARARLMGLVPGSAAPIVVTVATTSTGGGR